MKVAAGEASIATDFLPSISAANAVLPEPQKGSIDKVTFSGVMGDICLNRIERLLAEMVRVHSVNW